MLRLLRSLALLLLLVSSCSGGKDFGEPCSSSSDCASEICVGGGTCPKTGASYSAFCAGVPCQDQDCTQGQTCISVAADDSLKVCAPASLCGD